MTTMADVLSTPVLRPRRRAVPTLPRRRRARGRAVPAGRAHSRRSGSSVITRIEQLPERFAQLIVREAEAVARLPAPLPGGSKPGRRGRRRSPVAPRPAARPRRPPRRARRSGRTAGSSRAGRPGRRSRGPRARAAECVAPRGSSSSAASIEQRWPALSASLQIPRCAGPGPARARRRRFRAAPDRCGTPPAGPTRGGGGRGRSEAPRCSRSWVAVGSLSAVGGGGSAADRAGTGGGGTAAVEAGGGLGGGGGRGIRQRRRRAEPAAARAAAAAGAGTGRGPGVYRSNASLLAVIQRYAAGIQYCYGNELKRDPALQRQARRHAHRGRVGRGAGGDGRAEHASAPIACRRVRSRRSATGSSRRSRRA